MRPPRAGPRRRTHRGGGSAGDDRGSSFVELLLTLPLLFIALLVGLQLLIHAGIGTAAQNAARTGARSATLGDDGRAEALRSLNAGLRSRAQVAVVRTPAWVTVRVRVRVPEVLPVLPGRVVVTRSATFPRV